MSIFTDIALDVLSHLPKVFNWWLYSPDRTIQRIDVNVLAHEGSVEVWCDREQAKFSLYVQFKNNNPFSIEIDRAEACGSLYTARLKAINLLGMRLKKGKSGLFHLEGKIDDINLKRVNESPENESMRVDLRGVIINKYHTIRNYSASFDRLMCKLINRNI